LEEGGAYTNSGSWLFLFLLHNVTFTVNLVHILLTSRWWDVGELILSVGEEAAEVWEVIASSLLEATLEEKRLIMS
jgi:hypothetical protein